MNIELGYPLVGNYPVTQWFGENPKWYPNTNGHAGIDWGCQSGTPVYAMARGIVTKLADDPTGYGVHVRLSHVWDGKPGKTIYAHLRNWAVKINDEVYEGDRLGWSGNTGNSSGPHLHAEVRINDKAIDFKKYLRKQQEEPTVEDEVTKPIGWGMITADVLNIRSEPTKNSNVIGSIPYGVWCGYFDKSKDTYDNWWVMLANGAWCAAVYDENEYMVLSSL